MDTSELQSFGFSENEARIYLTLLEFGTLSPYELAERTGLNRSYLYDLLNRMVEKGYVSTLKIRNKGRYQATSPELIEELFQIRASEFKKLIPQLEELKHPVDETTVELHKGKEVYKTLIKDELKTLQRGDSNLLIIPDEREFEKIEPVFIQQMFRRLREMKIVERVITKKGGYKFNLEDTYYKELPPEMIGNTSTFIYGDKVGEIVFGNPNYLVITKNREMAEAKRKLFEHLWSIAEEPKD